MVRKKHISNEWPTRGQAAYVFFYGSSNEIFKNFIISPTSSPSLLVHLFKGKRKIERHEKVCLVYRIRESNIRELQFSEKLSCCHRTQHSGRNATTWVPSPPPPRPSVPAMSKAKKKAYPISTLRRCRLDSGVIILFEPIVKRWNFRRLFLDSYENFPSHCQQLCLWR